MVAFDYKKEYKEFYLPSGQPQVIIFLQSGEREIPICRTAGINRQSACCMASLILLK